MIPVTEHTIELAGHRARALEVQGRGPGLVLLHGWSASADTWRPLLAEARRERPARDRHPDLRRVVGRASGLAQAACCRSSTTSRPRSSSTLVPTARWSCSVDSLGADVALRLAERAGDLPLAGVIPMAPAGSRRPAGTT